MAGSIFSDIVPSVTSGNQLAALLNSFKDAVASGFSGTSRPPNLQAGGYWIDTTDDLSGIWYMKIWTGALDITVFALNKNTGAASVFSTDSQFEVRKFSDDDVPPTLKFLKSRFTGPNKQTLIGDEIGSVDMYGTNAVNGEVLMARIYAVANDNTTSAVSGSYIVFESTTKGTTGPSEVMRIVDGKLAIGHIAPAERLHIQGNFKAFREADDAVGAKLILRKKRVASSGQVLANDVISQVDFNSTDNAAAEFTGARIEASATQNHTDTLRGTRVKLQNIKTGENTLSDILTIQDDITLNRKLVANVIEATHIIADTVESTTVIESEDASILLNKGGTQAGADAAVAGFEVEMSDSTNVKVGYDSTTTSKIVVGEVGNLKEVIVADLAQTVGNKAIVDPSKLDVKKDTEANLITWAAGVNGSSGQIVYATDTDTYYGVVDNELTPLGGGAGGSSLVWKSNSANAPIKEQNFGLELLAFDAESSQEVWALVSVPTSYRTGKPIKLKGGSFATSAVTGNILFKALASLIEPSSTVLGAFANTHTSTNTELVAAGVANTVTNIGDVDLTSAIGEINGQAVAAGDKILVKLYRDNAGETVSAAADAKVLIDGFEIAFS